MPLSDLISSSPDFQITLMELYKSDSPSPPLPSLFTSRSIFRSIGAAASQAPQAYLLCAEEGDGDQLIK